MNRPGYYKGKGGMQPFDVIDAFGLDFYEGNAVKYLCRWRRKDGLADLHKARTYVQILIEREEKRLADEQGAEDSRGGDPEGGREEERTPPL